MIHLSETCERDCCPFCCPDLGSDLLSDVCFWHRLLLFCRLTAFLVRGRQSLRTWRKKR